MWEKIVLLISLLVSKNIKIRSSAFLSSVSRETLVEIEAFI